MKLPDLFTSLTVILAWAAMVALISGHNDLSIALILFAFCSDMLDGPLARRLGVASQFGAQFDAGADILVYLVYPALAFWIMLGVNSWYSLAAIGLMILAGIFRLARFTADGFVGEGKEIAYMGLPVVFTHLLLLILVIAQHLGYVPQEPLVVLVILLLSGLMVARFKCWKPQGFALLFVFAVVFILGSFFLFLAS